MDKDYICGCGKAYGSYPAFSTHRKIKHNNQTVPGTQIPTQEKSKRGRPSCDFKKVPQMFGSRKEYLQGLHSIQIGLLELEDKYKGKILSDPYENQQSNLREFSHIDDKEKQRIEFLGTFTRILTTHMKKNVSHSVVLFIQKLIQYGIESNELVSINIYNRFCLNNFKQMSNWELGFDFYVRICLMLSKWLCIMGVTKQILKMKSK